MLLAGPPGRLACTSSAAMIPKSLILWTGLSYYIIIIIIIIIDTKIMKMGWLNKNWYLHNNKAIWLRAELMATTVRSTGCKTYPWPYP